MIAGNQQPDNVYRPPSHIVSATSDTPDSRSSLYNSTTGSSSIPTTSAFSRPSVSTRQSHPSTSSSHTNPSSTIVKAPSTQHKSQLANDFRQYSHYPADAASSSSSSSIQESESRTMSPSRSRRSSQDSPPPPQPQRIRLRDIAHIVELALDDPWLQPRSPGRRLRREEGKRIYEISSMPVTDVIEMVARLLTKITQTNDRTHHDMHRNISGQDGSSGITGASSSILAFHGKNVPSITIQSYLSRIHKYCPTSYEVFLSLLVYFDRMTEKVNQNAADWRQGRSRGFSTTPHPQTPPPQPQTLSPISGASCTAGESTISGLSVSDAYNMSHFFVVDSYNIHRLVIAGVTCASKFFSDIFYTNSRYAKVQPPLYALPRGSWLIIICTRSAAYPSLSSITSNFNFSS